MIKSILLVALGAVGALEADKRLGSVKARFRPRVLTDTFFDSVNKRLEKDRRQP